MDPARCDLIYRTVCVAYRVCCCRDGKVHVELKLRCKLSKDEELRELKKDYPSDTLLTMKICLTYISD